MPRLRTLLFVTTLLVGLTACGSQQDATTDSTAPPVERLPVPTDDVVLTIRGATRPNVGEEVQADIAGIESLGTTTVRIHEPFLNEELEFTGVRVADLLAAAGVEPDAELVWTALDDYTVNFTRRQVEAEDAILATQIGGTPIDIADGGPIRILFTDHDGTLARDTNQWIWSLHLIEVG